MTVLVLAITVGILFACGAYLILRRGQIKLILGLGLLSHAVNLLLFGSGRLTRGAPPIFMDKKHYLEELAALQHADPLPQALILTAIVISFGITAFVVVLVHRRHVLANTDVVQGEYAPLLRVGDPFAETPEAERDAQALLAESTQWLVDELAAEVDEVYDRDVFPGAAPPPEAPELDESAALEEDEDA